MTIRTLNISLGRLKLEANFDLRVGESMVLAILRNKVHARLCFAQASEMDLSISFMELIPKGDADGPGSSNERRIKGHQLQLFDGLFDGD